MYAVCTRCEQICVLYTLANVRSVQYNARIHCADARTPCVCVWRVCVSTCTCKLVYSLPRNSARTAMRSSSHRARFFCVRFYIGAPACACIYVVGIRVCRRVARCRRCAVALTLAQKNCTLARERRGTHTHTQRKRTRIKNIYMHKETREAESCGKNDRGYICTDVARLDARAHR